MKSALLFSLLLLTSFALDVVPEYDLEAYLGDWFEVASSPFVHRTFERKGFCDRARYGKKSDGTLSVLNVERKDSPSGQVKDIKGYAYIPDPKVPAKLKVHLDGAPIDGANYWIVRLGPIIDGKYSWAIVSEPDMLFMWVLARDVDRYRKQEEFIVQEIAVYELGFNGLLNKYTPRSWEGCVPYDD